MNLQTQHRRCNKRQTCHSHQSIHKTICRTTRNFTSFHIQWIIPSTPRFHPFYC